MDPQPKKQECIVTLVYNYNEYYNPGYLGKQVRVKTTCASVDVPISLLNNTIFELCFEDCGEEVGNFCWALPKKITNINEKLLLLILKHRPGLIYKTMECTDDEYKSTLMAIDYLGIKPPALKVVDDDFKQSTFYTPKKSPYKSLQSSLYRQECDEMGIDFHDVNYEDEVDMPFVDLEEEELMDEAAAEAEMMREFELFNLGYDPEEDNSNNQIVNGHSELNHCDFRGQMDEFDDYFDY